MPKPAVNLKGKTFGRWTVIARAGTSPSGVHARWECICECGTTRSVPSHTLIHAGPRISCGCWKRELSDWRRQWEPYGDVPPGQDKTADAASLDDVLKRKWT